MNTDFTDSIRGRGSVFIEIIDKKTGKIVDKFGDHNLIVKVGRNQLINLIAGLCNLVPGQTSKISKIQVGSGGTAAGTPFTPIAPQDADANLITPIASGMNNLTSVSVDLNQTSPQVTFIALFDCSIVNSLVNECGLFFNDAKTIFARYTFKTVSLEAESNFSMQISWTISF
jgi:hypothetical protein